MSENSKIEWTDHTFNPWEGCQKVGPGCDHCYAETRNARFGAGVAVNWGPGAPRRRTSAANWRKPLQWNAAHREFYAAHGRRQRVFCASLADVFDNAVDPAWRRDLFGLIELTPNLNWQLLTKRIGNVFEMVARARSHDWLAGRDNVWLGATIVNQAEANRDIPKLLETPARVRFLSVEPLLGAVDLERPMPGPDLDQGSGAKICQPWMIQSGIDWVIVGGESGRGARPMHPDWTRALRDQCNRAAVPFLFKQWGEFIVPEDGAQACRVCGCTWNNACPGGCYWAEPDLCSACVSMTPAVSDRPVRYQRVGKRAAGRQLDGRTHDDFPKAR
jgi:protein gp37